MKFHPGLILAGLMALTLTAFPQSDPTRAAVINGQAISVDQVVRAAASDLEKLDANRPQSKAEYDRERLKLMWKALDSIIEDQVVAAEAAEMKMTKEEFLRVEIEDNVVIPSPAEVDAFYEANKEQIPFPKAQALPQVRQFMVDQSRRRLRQPLIQRLRQKYGVVTYLDPVRTEVATEGHPSRGPADAPVTIVEFADFQCPFCGALFPQLKLVEATYADKLRVVYRQFPLTTIHPHAQKAAEASLCANEQQRFWEYHDSLFRNQQDLTVDALKRRAADLKLDTTRFDTCLDSGQYADAVAKDKADGSEHGVAGTPTVFINGRLLTGAPTYANIKTIIDDELQRANVR